MEDKNNENKHPIFGKVISTYSVASAVMWHSALGHELSQGEAEIEDHIKNGVIESLKIPSAPHHHANAIPVWSRLRREPELLLSSQDRFQHRCWSC